MSLNDETTTITQTPAPAPETSTAPAPPAAPASNAPAPVAAEPALSATDKAMQEMFGHLSDPDELGAPAAKADETPKPVAAEDKTKTATASEPKQDEDLTPPEGMKEASQQRWGKLTERVKAAETQYHETSTHLRAVQELVGKSTLNAEEFTNVLELGRLTKSSNPEDRRRAVTQLQSLLSDVASSVGMEVGGFDPLDKHADLKTAVDSMELTRERALELVQLRALQAQSQQTNQQQQEYQQTVQSVHTASKQAESYILSMAGTPGHEAKAAFVQQRLQDPAFQQQLVNNFQPHQWPHIVANMYTSYTPPAPAVAATPQPLRSGVSGVTRSNAPPKTMQESVMNHIEARFGV